MSWPSLQKLHLIVHLTPQLINLASQHTAQVILIYFNTKVPVEPSRVSTPFYLVHLLLQDIDQSDSTD